MATTARSQRWQSPCALWGRHFLRCRGAYRGPAGGQVRPQADLQLGLARVHRGRADHRVCCQRCDAVCGLHHCRARGRRRRRCLTFAFVTFCLWNIPADTYGFFLPFIIKNSGQTNQAVSVGIDILWFGSAILAVGFIFIGGSTIERTARRCTAPPRSSKRRAGLDPDWEQFPELRWRHAGYQSCVEQRIGECGAHVVSGGLVDSAECGRAGGEVFAHARVDLVFWHAVTSATSESGDPRATGRRRTGRVARAPAGRALELPVGRHRRVAGNCTACCVPELAGACTRPGIQYSTVAGTIEDDDRAWRRIAAWADAASVRRAL